MSTTPAGPVKPRLWLSTRKPKKNEIVVVRAQVMHAMETGLRKRSSGELIPRRIIDRFDCSFNGAPVLSWRLDTAVSVNPYLEFRFRATQAGELKMTWSDEAGDRLEATEAIEIIETM